MTVEWLEALVLVASTDGSRGLPGPEAVEGVDGAGGTSPEACCVERERKDTERELDDEIFNNRKSLVNTKHKLKYFPKDNKT